MALAAVSERAAGHIYNIGESNALSELEWARTIARATDWRGELVVVPNDLAPAHLRPPGNYAQHWVADTTRVREELGYRERISREEAVARTVEWELANPPAQVDLQQFDYAAEDATLRSTAES